MRPEPAGPAPNVTGVAHPPVRADQNGPHRIRSNENACSPLLLTGQIFFDILAPQCPPVIIGVVIRQRIQPEPH